MTKVQKIIMQYIGKNFIKGSVRTSLIGDDGVRITDWKGESMVLTVNIYGHIIDADTRKIYAYDVLPYNYGKKADSKAFTKK